ncbi:hypothetical protein [Archangium violaceum]|uniref:hypothetical protein n=1 Tax=Archangium violaceum TaxID=83451 RepID=UPI0013634C8C|nr:hypothetical protein [Archangium violaceum]
MPVLTTRTARVRCCPPGDGRDDDATGGDDHVHPLGTERVAEARAQGVSDWSASERITSSRHAHSTGGSSPSVG